VENQPINRAKDSRIAQAPPSTYEVKIIDIAEQFSSQKSGQRIALIHNQSTSNQQHT
jgi:hypothetical protein